MTEIPFRGGACSHLFKDGEVLNREQLADKIGPYNMEGLEGEVFIMKDENDKVQE